MDSVSAHDVQLGHVMRPVRIVTLGPNHSAIGRRMMCIRHVFVLLTCSCSCLVGVGSFGQDTSQLLALSDRYDEVLALNASLATSRLTCIEAGPELDLILQRHLGTASLADAAAMEAAFAATAEASKAAPTVHLLKRRIDLTTDKRRGRSHVRSEGDDGSNRDVRLLDDSKYAITYESSSDADETGGYASIDKPGEGESQFQIRDILPTEPLAILKMTKEQGTIEVEASENGRDGRCIVHSIPQHGVTGKVCLDEDGRITYCVTDYGSYIEERQFTSYMEIGGIPIPRAQLRLRVRRDGQGQASSAMLELVQLRDIEINPSLSDADFTMAVPTRTTIQRFDGQTSVETIVTRAPVEDLSSHANDLAALAPTTPTGIVEEQRRNLPLVLLINVAIVVAIVIALLVWRRAQ